MRQQTWRLDPGTMEATLESSGSLSSQQHDVVPVAGKVRENAAVEDLPNDNAVNEPSLDASTADVAVADQEHDGDDEFQDAEALPGAHGASSGSHMDSVAVPIRAHISDDTEGPNDNIEDDVEEAEYEDASLASEDSFNSALERLAPTSTASVDATSPAVSYIMQVLEDSPSDSMDTVQQDALRRLNELTSGLPSLDTSLLENCSEDEFRNRVEIIAEAKELAQSDVVVIEILNALLPLVRERTKSKGSTPSKPERAMPVAKLTAEEDDEDMEGESGGEIDGLEQDEDEVVENRPNHTEAHADSKEPEAHACSPESFYSALERMAATYTAALDPISPEASYMMQVLEDSPSDSMDTVQQDALRRLNELNSGLPSLDASLLESCSEDEFRNRVEIIAEAKELAPSDVEVLEILNALLPLVQERTKSKGSTPSNPERAMPVAKLTAEEDMEGGSGGEIDGIEQDEDEVVENRANHIEAHTDSEEPEADSINPQHAGGLRVRIVDEDLSSPASFENHGSRVEDLVSLDPSLVEEGHKLAIDGAAGEGKLIPESEGDAYEAHGSDLKLEITSIHTEAGGSQANLETEVLRNTQGEDAIHNEGEGSQPKVDIEVLKNIQGEDVNGGENDQEEESDSSVGSNLADNAKSRSFQVLEANDGEEAGRNGKTGGENGAMLPQQIQCEREEGKLFNLAGEDTTNAEKLGVETGKAEPLNEDTTISSTENFSLHENLNLGQVLVDRQIESDQNMSLEPELAVGADEGGREEQHHEDQKPRVDDCGSIFTPLDVQSDKESADLRKHIEAQVKANGLRELQSGTDLLETCVEPVAEVKKEPTHKEDSALPIYLGEKTILQQGPDSLESGLLHRVPNGDKEGGAWEEEEEDDDDNDNDEEETHVESSLRAFMRSSESAAQNTDTSSVAGGAGLSLPARPAGLGRSMPALEPAPRTTQHNRSNGSTVSRPSVPVEDNQLNGDVGDGNEETREKLHMIRVKFLRLAHRLGQTAHNVVVAQVLYRLGLAEQLRGGRSSSRTGSFSFERANVIAEEQEAAGQGELDFTCTIMLLGKTGVGKSATLNSIFDEVKSGTDAFTPATKKVREITGTVHGINLRVIDTPGLLPSFADQRHNERIMSSVKRFIKKSPPDIVLYFDRLDMQSRDYGDLPLLRTITDTFGAAIWFNAIVVLTHASSAPPDGANGAPLSYEMFVAQRSHVVQQTIRQAAGDMRLMNPVSLVENHPACRTNRSGQRVLPNGQVWKPQLLLLCFASKILAEANSLLKLQDSSPGRPFGIRPRVPPLPFLLSSLLQSRAQLKLPEEQMGDEDESDEDLDEESELDDEVEYDELPPFRRLTKDELALLDEEQRKAYFEELDYREKLFKKKQWKEELRRRSEMRKRMATASKEEPQPLDEFSEEENSRSAAVPVPMPDMVLPPSFDSDNPSHRYRYLETASQWLVRPVLETHGWDHDSGYDGFNLEKVFVISKAIPASISGQITKDKKEANLQMEAAASFKHGEGKSTLCGVDVQTIGKDLAYTLRNETRFNNFRRNKTTGGLAVTFLGDTIATGMKLEDKLMVGKRLKLVLNAGAITGRGDVAYGGSFEATLRDKDYPVGRTLTTLGLSIMNWHGDLAIGGNLQSQLVIGKTLLVGRANLNNRGAGQISIRASSSDQIQIALIGIIPILRALIANRLLSSSQAEQ